MRNNQTTIADIAKELGISKSTVSRVLSGKGRISTETRSKVMNCVEKMDYRPNLLAKGLATSKTFNIGVVLPGDASQTDMPYFHNCLAGIASAASKENYDVLVSVSSAQDTTSLERVIKNNKVDGVILTRLLEDDRRVALLKGHKIPFVVIGTCDDPDVIQVDSCNVQACTEFTEMLTDRGYKKFIFICGNQDIVVNRQRLEGFENAMKNKSISEASYTIFKDINDGSAVRQSLKDLILEEKTCIVCADDFLCSNAYSWLKEQEKSEMEKVQLASFYESSLLKQTESPIFTIDINAYNIGSRSAEIMLSQISGKPVSNRNFVEYEFHFGN